MKWVLKILRKRLDEEKKWERYEKIAVDLKTKEGVRMAKERIPQLQSAIEILNNQQGIIRSEKGVETKRGEPKDRPHRQLNLFQ